MKYSHIAIEGVIGAGKTTIARFLAKKLDARLLLEEFEDNPFLSKFYENPDQYAFSLEMAFLASRYHQIQQYIDPKDLFGTQLISDFVLYKSLVFASINLKEDEARLYRRLFDIMFQQIPTPDLTIYIYHKTSDLIANIAARGRDYEQQISPDYLEQIHENYLQYFKQLTHHRILIVDGRKMDIIHNPSAPAAWLEIIEKDYPLGISWG